MTGSVPAVFQPFVKQYTVLLETRKRDGSWVGTPVNIAVRGDHGYVRTWHTSGKAKRLRNFPEARICPSTFRGKPTGPRVAVTVRLLDGDEADAAATLLRGKHPFVHGWLVPFVHRRRGVRTLHYELSGVSELDR